MKKIMFTKTQYFVEFILWIAFILYIKDTNAKLLITFVLVGGLHISKSDILVKWYNKPQLPFVPKFTPKGLKIIGVLVVLMGLAIPFMFK